MSDRLRAGRQPHSLIACFVKIFDGLRNDPCFEKMPGQLDGDLFGLLSVEGFQDITHFFVKLRFLHLIEAVIKVSLEQDMLEKI